ncbi:MAG: threonyl-tRNA synthetase editing domain-containing protein [Candidatus Micrarchaeota archaeon]
MLILFEHTEYFKWKAVSPGEKMVEDDAPLVGFTQNALVAFTTILNEDVAPDTVEKLLAKVVKRIYKTTLAVNATTVVLYPFAHLSNQQLAEPKIAIGILRQIEMQLLQLNPRLTVVRTPFGWHKQREGKTAGHEQSVLLREVRI